MILLLDVMSTLVYDPFAHELPAFFGLTLDELIARKHPTAWVDFERDDIDEPTFLRLYFPDQADAIDGDALRDALRGAYRFLDGVEPLLHRLKAADVEMHALSNYPRWSTLIEERLALSRFLSWRFVSWRTGVRKPHPEAYLGPARALDVEPSECLFVDDREGNCEAARAVGMKAVRFEDAAQLERDLRRHDLLP